MEVDGDYSDDITSFRINEARGHDLFSLTKKRKFLSEPNEQQSKHICCEIGKPEPFSNQSLQGEEDFYMRARRGKAPSREVEDDTNTREESMQDSNSVSGESFSQSSEIKSSYDDSSLTSLQSGRAISSRIREEKLDEFGQCLTYLASACGTDSNKLETDPELEEFLYSNGIIPSSSKEEDQVSTSKVTIDQEFEQYFSTLML